MDSKLLKVLSLLCLMVLSASPGWLYADVTVDFQKEFSVEIVPLDITAAGLDVRAICANTETKNGPTFRVGAVGDSPALAPDKRPGLNPALYFVDERHPAPLIMVERMPDRPDMINLSMGFRGGGDTGNTSHLIWSG